MNDYLKIDEITKRIKLNETNESIRLFGELIDSIPANSTYINWDHRWIKSVYDLGKVFETKNPEVYLSKINSSLAEFSNKKEVIHFIQSEIIFNYFSEDQTFVRESLKELKNNYPTNPEFCHNYSHVLDNDGGHKESLKLLEHCIKIDPCDRFVYTYINRVRNTFNKFLSKNQISEGEVILKNANKLFDSMSLANKFPIYSNVLAQFRDRLEDHKTIQNKISKIDGIISRRTESLRNRFISMIGVFAAIIAFILTSVNIAISNLDIKDIMLLMLTMADVLIIFALSLDYIFYIRRKGKSFFSFLEDKQFWGIIILLILLYILYKTV